MTTEEELRIKLRKIEALFAGAATEGERNAAEAALGRIKGKLAQAIKETALIEYKFTFVDHWSKQLFVALCRRYTLEPYRYVRQRYTTVMVRVPPTFLQDVLEPEYSALNQELREYLNAATQKIIAEEIHADTTEAQEVEQFLENKVI